MKLKLFFLFVLFVPISMTAMSIEEEAGNLLGQSYKSEAAQAFFKKLNLKTDFQERGTFTYNFYEKGLSLKIDGGEYIQAIQVYSQTLLFKTFPENVYGKKLSEVYNLNDIYKVIKMAPIVEDEANGTLIYPNKKPADYLVRVVRKKDNTMRAIAWMLDNNAMEKIISEANPIEKIEGFDSHEAVWDLLGNTLGSKVGKAVYESKFLDVKGKDKLTRSSYKIGLLFQAFRVEKIEFLRRGFVESKASFEHALPSGLHWWSSVDEFSKYFETKAAEPTIGFYAFGKETEKGTIELIVNQGILTRVTFKIKK